MGDWLVDVKVDQLVGGKACVKVVTMVVVMVVDWADLSAVAMVVSLVCY